MLVYDYDLIVVGGGVAGLSAALFANSIGKKVAIIERNRIGGNCSNRTCLPKTALAKTADIAEGIRSCTKYGLELNDNNLCTKEVMKNVRGVVEKIHAIDKPEGFKEIGIDIIEEKASFKDKHTVIAGERELTSAKFILACGTVPFIPPIKGIDKVPFLSSEDFYSLNELPKSIVILGGGPAGIEIASTLCRLGVKTYVVEMAERILFNEDEEMVELLERHLKEKGIEIFTGFRASEVSEKEGKVTVTAENKKGEKEDISAEIMLVMLGRKPDISALNLESIGIEVKGKGIKVSTTLETPCKGVYAVGDVAGPMLFAATAEMQGIAAARNAFLPFGERVRYDKLTWVTFTKPQLARSGLTEAEARKKFGKNIKVYKYDYKNVRRAIAERADIGRVKIICNSGYKILGVHILGESAEEMIHEPHLMRVAGIPLYKLHSVPHAYPTYSEAVVKRLGDMCYTDRMTDNILVKLALKILPGYRNRLDLIKKKL